MNTAPKLLEQQARDLLDTALRTYGLHEDAYHVGCGGKLDMHDQAAIDAIIAALAPPSGEGVDNPNVAVLHRIMHYLPDASDRAAVDHAAAELSVLWRHYQRAATQSIDPDSRNFKEGMKVGLSCENMLADKVRNPVCDICGARNAAEAETLCKPSGDNCPGSEWPLSNLWALTTPPPASQERGRVPTIRLLPKGTAMLGFNPEGELKVDCFEIQHMGNVQIVPVCSAKPLPPDDGEARARKLYEPDDITASPPSSAAEEVPMIPTCRVCLRSLPAPPNSLPSWAECQGVIANYEFRMRAEAGLESFPVTVDEPAPEPSVLHRFIYEYDDADRYRSAWFMHRLEKLIEWARATKPVPEQAQAGELCREVGEFMCSIGWKDDNDAQWSRLRNNLPQLVDLLRRLAGGVTVDYPMVHLALNAQPYIDKNDAMRVWQLFKDGVDSETAIRAALVAALWAK